MLRTTEAHKSIDPEHFDTFRYVDRKFEHKLAEKEIKDSKGTKLGKILGSQFNIGTAVVDIPRLLKNGVNEKYFIEDKQVTLWQPLWLKLIEAEEQMKAQGESEQGPTLTPEEMEELNL